MRGSSCIEPPAARAIGLPPRRYALMWGYGPDGRRASVIFLWEAVEVVQGEGEDAAQLPVEFGAELAPFTCDGWPEDWGGV